ncbi:MAG: hemolysin family protein [Holosporaceae bacterium]|jgi:CBS domain containing-hemolysin-like protein|nr:hemolysin family protein [Holosporaceae bacterium]
MVSKIKSYLSKLFKKEEDVPLIDRLEDLIESDSKTIDERDAGENSELALVSNVIGLRDLTAEDIMVPRAEIVAARIDTTFDGFIEIFSQNSFSQIPIYKDTLDDVVGIVRVRDFITYIKNPESFNLKPLLREVIYVVPSIQLLELLVEIRASVNHMALVVDEFGGIDGLVTLHDVASEIVGEIQQNQRIFPQIITRPDGSLIVDAKMPIIECENLLKIDLLKPLTKGNNEDSDVETVGGLTMLLAGRMPTRGETLIHPSGLEFDITEADPRRVKRVLIRRSQGLSM